MTHLRRALIPIAIAATALGGVVTLAQTSSATTSAAAPAAAPVVHSATIAGTDMHSLDPHLKPMFVNGGGVEAVYETDISSPPIVKYFETGVDLPIGAKVKSIQVTARGCRAANPPVVVFGSYQPTTGNTLQNATFNFAGSCTTQTLTKSGNPITTVVAGRRYALDFYINWAVEYPGSPSTNNTFFGATIKYTCTSPCVP